MVTYTDGLTRSPAPCKEGLGLSPSTAPPEAQRGGDCPPDEAAELSVGRGPPGSHPLPRGLSNRWTSSAHVLWTRTPLADDSRRPRTPSMVTQHIKGRARSGSLPGGQNSCHCGHAALSTVTRDGARVWGTTPLARGPAGAQRHPSIRRGKCARPRDCPWPFYGPGPHVNHGNGDASGTRQEGPEKTAHSLAPGWAILQRENEL